MSGAASVRSSAPRPAIVHGPPLVLPADTPASVQSAIAARVASCPHGTIRTYTRTNGGRVASHQDLWRRAASIAAGLRRFGARDGAHVIVLTDDAIDFAAAFWGCLRGGFMAVPLMSAVRETYQQRKPDGFKDFVAGMRGAVVLADNRLADAAGALGEQTGLPVLSLAAADRAPADGFEDAAPADPPYLLPTSGSTGHLKLVEVSQRAALYRSFVVPLSTGHHWLGTFPLDGITGQNCVLVRYGSCTQIGADTFAARPISVLDAIQELQITALGLTASATRRVIAAAAQSGRTWDLSSLRHFGLGGEAVVQVLAENLGRFLSAHGASPAIIKAGYGTTETGVLVQGANPIASTPVDALSLGACAPGARLRVVGDDGEVVAEGDIGELQASCPQTGFSAYWGEPGATRECFTADGWWRTGDLGRLQNGELSLHGRAKEIFIVSGKKISLAAIDAEIEASLDEEVRAFSCAVHWPGEVTERLAVVFVPADERFGGHAEIAESLSRAVARRFGFRPNPVIAASMDDIPLAAGGKIRRSELAERIQSGRIAPSAVGLADADVSGRQDREEIESRLEQIWRDVLNLEGKLDRHADFFDLGGDSLRSLTLSTAVEEQFGRQISAEAFFEQPTFSRLLDLVAREGRLAGPVSEAAVPWPLSWRLRNQLLFALETWEGDRPTRDRLVVGLNTAGTKTPLFWVCQGYVTLRELADSLGADQPVYGFRSGEGLIAYTEDEVQSFALRYVAEIGEICPDGPVFVGGNCQGAIFALAAAQHLLRRGRHVPLLILLDWGFPLQPYAAPLLLIYGRDAMQDNPYLQFQEPDRLRGRVFADYSVVEMPGEHGVYYENAFREVLPLHMRKAETPSVLLIPRSAHRALLSSDDIPAEMEPGKRATVTVDVVNMSAVTWPGAEHCTLALGNRWLDKAGNLMTSIDGRVPLPEIAPGASARLALQITAPLQPGHAQLIIDLVEEGNIWFNLPQKTPLRGRVRVGPDEIRPNVDELAAELAAARDQAAYLKNVVAGYEASTSWKLTRPLRAAKALQHHIRRLLARSGRPPS